MDRFRKEQVLLVLVALLAFWIFYKSDKDVRTVSLRGSAATEYTLQVGADAPLADPAKGIQRPRNIHIEPSESQPLEPRTLAFPEVRDAPWLLPPMGQQPLAYYLLRMDLKGVEAALPAAGQGAEGEAEEAGPVPGVQPGAGQDPTGRYDKLVLSSGNVEQPFYGFFLGEDDQKFAAASGERAAAQKLRFQWMNYRDGTFEKILELDGGELNGQTFVRLELAKTLRNEVGMRIYQRRASNDPREQLELLDWLLEKAEQEAWVYEDARKRAVDFARLATTPEERYHHEARVLWAMGDLPGLLELYQGLPAELVGSSFQHRGLGRIYARLGLDKLAEEHLRKAVQINKPIDPRNYAALAHFYMDQNRPEDALPLAGNAVEYRMRNKTSAEEKMGFDRLLVFVHLALGDVAAAEKARPSGAMNGQRVISEYLDACIAYAKKDFGTARTAFQRCAAELTIPEAQLGLACCDLGEGKVLAALSQFEALAASQPRLRHLALGGASVCVALTLDEKQQPRLLGARQKVDDALVAFPGHPYLLWLRGRLQRLDGDLDGAIASLTEALQVRDDFLEALWELSLAYHTRFEANQDAEAIVTARRYIDRLIRLDRAVGGDDPRLNELQGLIHFKNFEYRSAREAFTAAQDKSKFCEIGLGIIEYTQKRRDRAEGRFTTMVRDLPVDHWARIFAQDLLEQIADHAGKEQVIDRFDRERLGESWERGGRFGLTGKIEDGVLVIQSGSRPPNRDYDTELFRSIEGPGRFVSCRVEMEMGLGHQAQFTGLIVRIPVRGSKKVNFEVKLGIDARERVMLHVVDGRNKESRPQYFEEIKLERGRSHSLEIAALRDPKNKKSKRLFLSPRINGQALCEPIPLQTLRASDRASRELRTVLASHCRANSPTDLRFKNYVRVQEKSK